MEKNKKLFAGKEISDFEKEMKKLFASKISSDNTSREPFVFVFDESRELLKLEIESRSAGELIFNGLRHIIRTLKRRKVFVIFIDTPSKLSKLVPQTKKDPGAKVAQGSSRLCDPIYLIPTWNVHLDVSPTNIREASSKDYLYKIGRPLWNSLYEKYMIEDEMLNDNIQETYIIQLAVEKLCGGNNITNNIYDSDTILTAIASRTSININSYSPRIENLVANYMAMCIYINDERNDIRALYLSEPTLIEAAAILFNRITYPTLINNFERIHFAKCCYERSSRRIYNGIHFTGSLGSYMPRYKKNSKNEWRFHQMVKVKDYLEALFGDTVLTIMKNQISKKKLKTLLNGYLFFTHFVGVKYFIKKKDLKKYLNVGAAIFNDHYQVGCDIILPIALNEEIYDEKKTSVLY